MRGLFNWHRKHLLLGDFLIVLVLCFVAYGSLYYFGYLDSLLARLDTSRSQYYSAISSIAGALLGFIITAISIIATISDIPKFKLLTGSPVYRELFNIFFDATYWLAGATIYALVALAFDSDKVPVKLITLLGLFIFTVSTARVWRCVNMLKKVAILLAS